VRVAHLEFGTPHAEEKPRHILEEIVWEKDREVAAARERVSLEQLKGQVAKLPPSRDFVAALRASCRKPAVIAEVKKASPSKGVIREKLNFHLYRRDHPMTERQRRRAVQAQLHPQSFGPGATAYARHGRHQPTKAGLRKAIQTHHGRLLRRNLTHAQHGRKPSHHLKGPVGNQCAKALPRTQVGPRRYPTPLPENSVGRCQHATVQNLLFQPCDCGLGRRQIRRQIRRGGLATQGAKLGPAAGRRGSRIGTAYALAQLQLLPR
jgi:hypothetical protein